MPFIFILVVFFGYSFFKLFHILSQNWTFALISELMLFLVIFFSFLGPRKFARFYTEKWFKALNLLAMFIFGVWSSYLFTSIFLDTAYFFYQSTNPECCDFHSFAAFSRWTLLVLSIFAILGYFVATNGFKVPSIKIKDKRVTRKLHIVQISDLHIGPTIQNSFVEKISQTLKKLNPDLIVLTGDIVDGTPQGVASVIQKMGEWTAVAPNLYVTGNHEYYWGAQEIIQHLRASGIQVLMNERVSMPEHNIEVLGIPDQTGRSLGGAHSPQLEKLTQGIGVDTFNILLAHQPNAYKSAFEHNVSLLLCGHTHGGQYFPFNLVIGLFHKYAKGLSLHQGRMWIYVHKGTGYWGPRHRFGARPEIASILIEPQDK